MRRGPLGAAAIPAEVITRLTAAEQKAAAADTLAQQAKDDAAAAQSTGANARQMILNRDPKLTQLEQTTAGLNTLADTFQATATASAADRAALHAQLDAIKQEATVISVGTGRITVALLLGSSTDITVTLSRTMANTTYKVDIAPTNGMSFTVKTRTTTTVTVTVTAALALAVGQSFQLIAWA